MPNYSYAFTVVMLLALDQPTTALIARPGAARCLALRGGDDWRQLGDLPEPKPHWRHNSDEALSKPPSAGHLIRTVLLALAFWKIDLSFSKPLRSVGWLAFLVLI